MPDPARGGMDEDSGASAQGTMGDKTLPSCQSRQRHRRRLGEDESRRDRSEQVGTDGHAIRIAALVVRGHSHTLIADGPPSDATPDRLDNTGDITAENSREPISVEELRHDALTHLAIDRVDTCGHDPKHNLVVCRRGLAQQAALQRVGAAEAGNRHGAHWRNPLNLRGPEAPRQRAWPLT